VAELNCREASRILSHSLDRELSADEHDLLMHHLSLCTACRNFKEQVEFLRGAARRYGPQGGEDTK
jgi:predicted anti-sigma-YlaC factor YlaD